MTDYEKFLQAKQHSAINYGIDPNKIEATNKSDKYKEIWNKAQQFSSDPETQKYLFNVMIKGGADENEDTNMTAAATRGYQGSSNKES